MTRPDSNGMCWVIAAGVVEKICAVAERVDAMVTGRATPIILLAVRALSVHGFAGRRNARRALDGNLFMWGSNPHPHSKSGVAPPWANGIAPARKCASVPDGEGHPNDQGREVAPPIRP